MVALTLFRHPKPRVDRLVCLGRLDVDVDPRKAKRLAHRIRARARRAGAARVVVTSPLGRARDVGRWLGRWGWRHVVDSRLSEVDFGDWQGSLWSSIDAARMAPWMQDFAHHQPGGGESVLELVERCREFLFDERVVVSATLVTHAGWLSAVQWIADSDDQVPNAFDWPHSLPYGAAFVWPAKRGFDRLGTAKASSVGASGGREGTRISGPGEIKSGRAKPGASQTKV